MKKVLTILIIIIVIAGVGAGAYWLGTKKSGDQEGPEDITIGGPAKVDKLPEVNYKEYSGKHLSFKYPDWIAIAPEEIMKATAKEQLENTQILLFATNPDGAQISLSVRTYNSNEKDFAQMISEDIMALSRKVVPSLQLISEDYWQDKYQHGVLKFEFDLMNQKWVDRSYLILIKADMKEYLYSIDLVLPDRLSQSYEAVWNEIKDSVKITE